MYVNDYRQKQRYPPLGRKETISALAHRLREQGVTYQQIHQEVIFRDLTRERIRENPKLMDYSSRVLREIDDYMVSHNMVNHQTQSLDQIMNQAAQKQNRQQRSDNREINRQINR